MSEQDAFTRNLIRHAAVARSAYQRGDVRGYRIALQALERAILDTEPARDVIEPE